MALKGSVKGCELLLFLLWLVLACFSDAVPDARPRPEAGPMWDQLPKLQGRFAIPPPTTTQAPIIPSVEFLIPIYF